MLAEKVIRKHVAIIHAYSLMSALQRKIINVLLYEAANNHNGITHSSSVVIEHRIPFSLLSKAVNFNSNNTQYLKEAIDNLASLKIEWNLLKDKVPTDISFLNLRVLHGAPTFYQDGTFNFSFHKVMLELTHNPPVYGTVDLEIQAQFESKYGHALYENSTRFVNLNKNKIVHLDTFRRLLGVDDNKYPSMRELTRNVIQPSVEEVNDRADFIVKLSGVKAGRKIIGFELEVNAKKKSICAESQVSTDKRDKLSQEIKQTFGEINETILRNLFKQYPEEYILEKIIYTKTFAKKNSKGIYPTPYFISALRDNYKADDISTPQPNIKPETVVDAEDKQWHIKERELQADLAHWKNILSIQKEGDSNSRKNIERIVSQCEEKLQQHCLVQPTIQKEAV